MAGLELMHGAADADAKLEDLWRTSGQLLAGDITSLNEHQARELGEASRSLRNYYFRTLETAQGHGIEDIFAAAATVAAAAHPDHTVREEFDEREGLLRDALRALLQQPDDKTTRQAAHGLARAEVDIEGGRGTIDSLLTEPVEATYLAQLATNTAPAHIDQPATGSPLAYQQPLFDDASVNSYLSLLAHLEDAAQNGPVTLDGTIQLQLASGSRVLCEAVGTLLAAQQETGYYAGWNEHGGEAHAIIASAECALQDAYDRHQASRVLIAAAILHTLASAPTAESQALVSAIAAGWDHHG